MHEHDKNSLWLTFRLDGMDYCVLSDYIQAIIIPDVIDELPDSPNTIAGVTTYSGKILTVVEVRELFGKINLKTYVEQFEIMKELHVSWVDDLARYVKEGGEFTKAINPHNCKFGLWYDGFHTDNNRLNRLLRKISIPHERIHLCGAEIIALREQEGDHEAEILERLVEADDICRQDIVPLLDRLIDIYRTINRGVLLIIRNEDHPVGFLVDEVRALVPCNKADYRDFATYLKPSPFVRKMVVDGKTVLLELDVEQIIGEQLEGIDLEAVEAVEAADLPVSPGTVD